MYLSRIDVRRLGQLRDVTIDQLSPQLTIVYGPNEAGKSTVRDAIRYALFGFPAKGPSRGAVDARTYSGSDRQVAVRFIGDEGDIHVERTVDGKKLSEGVLNVSPESAGPLFKSMTEGIDSRMYHTMWNVSLANLAGIDPARSGESVLSKLLAAEHGTEVSPSVAISTLTKEMDAFFSNTKKDAPSVKASIGRIVDLRGALDLARSKAESIGDVRALLSSVDASIGETVAARRALQAKRTAAADDASTLKRLLAEAPGLTERVREAGEEYELNKERAQGGQSADIARILSVAAQVHTLELEQSLVNEKRAETEQIRASIDELTVRLDRYRDVPRVVDSADADRLTSQLDQMQARIARSEADLLVARADLEAERMLAAEPTGEPTPSGTRSIVPAVVALIAGAAITIATWTGGATTASVGLAAVTTTILAAFLWWWNTREPGSQAATSENGRLASASATCRAREVAVEQAWAAWHAYLAGEPLLSSLKDRVPEEVVAAVRQSASRANLEAELAVQTKRQERAIEVQADWNARVASVLSEAQPTGEDPLRSLDELAVSVRDAEHIAAAAKQAAESLPRVTRALESSREAQAQHAANLGQLIDTWSASTAAEASQSIQSALAQLEHSLEQADTELRALQIQSGELGQTIRTAEESYDVERLETDLEIAMSTLSGQTRAYVVSLLARTMIERGLEHFEGEERPGVMDSAGTVFAHLSGGAYEGVEAPEGEGNEIEVVAHDGSRKPAASLSVGTVEQLYLAIRFGALQALPTRGRELPVLLDEVLANYDETRSIHGYGAIAELAKSRQIVFFTCREEVAEGLRRAAAARGVDAVQVSMERGQVIG